MTPREFYKQERKRLGLTLEDIARRVNCCQTTVSNYEEGVMVSEETERRILLAIKGESFKGMPLKVGRPAETENSVSRTLKPAREVTLNSLKKRESIAKQKGYKAIGELIQKTRKARKLSVKQLANMAGVSADTVSKVELGWSRASDSLIVNLRQILQMNETEGMGTLEELRGFLGLDE